MTDDGWSSMEKGQCCSVCSKGRKSGVDIIDRYYLNLMICCDGCGSEFVYRITSSDTEEDIRRMLRHNGWEVGKEMRCPRCPV